MTWQPLSVRNGRTEDEGPFEGVPEHLFEPLRHWVDMNYTGESGSMSGSWGGPRLAAAVRFPIRPRPGQPLTVQEVTQFIAHAPWVMLDVVDAVLHLESLIHEPLSSMNLESFSLPWSWRCRELDELLELGGSVWRVGPNGDRLVRRVDPTSTASFVEASSPSDTASAELREAWTAAYGRNPDASDAWDHSIKAVEAILIPIVTPANAKATLGSVIKVLNDHPDLCWLELEGQDKSASADPLVSMLRLMWPNPDRHGGQGSREPTLMEAEAVVHLAVMIVQWARSGVLGTMQLGSLRGLVLLHHRAWDTPTLVDLLSLRPRPLPHRGGVGVLPRTACLTRCSECFACVLDVRAQCTS